VLARVLDAKAKVGLAAVDGFFPELYEVVVHGGGASHDSKNPNAARVLVGGKGGSRQTRWGEPAG
jgi:hypothetical protein